MRWWKALTAAPALAFPAGQAVAQTAPCGAPITSATMIDGTGAPPVPGASGAAHSAINAVTLGGRQIDRAAPDLPNDGEAK